MPCMPMLDHMVIILGKNSEVHYQKYDNLCTLMQ